LTPELLPLCGSPPLGTGTRSHHYVRRIVGRENVIAGSDCGLGGRIHPQIALAKLRALRDGAAISKQKTVE